MNLDVLIKCDVFEWTCKEIRFVYSTKGKIQRTCHVSYVKYNRFSRAIKQQGK